MGKFNYTYLLFPAIAVMVSSFGGMVTSGGMVWYKTLRLPQWTPPGAVIGAVWTLLYVLATISALMAFNNISAVQARASIMAVFALNALLNFGWTGLFFGKHMVGMAEFGAPALCLSVLALIFLIWPRIIVAAILLIPYACWVAFATYLNYVIYKLNK
jgi:translocator protein